MIERIFLNWKTTLVGGLLLLSGLLMVAFEKATLTEAGTFFGVAFVLFFTKDPKNG